MFENIMDYYPNRLRIVLADTPVLQQEVCRIRHRVYCEEFGWEPQTDSGMEIDGYDCHSSHILLAHLPSRQFVGCVRNILLDQQNPSKPFPFENHFSEINLKHLQAISGFERKRITETSRLSILSDFRNRQSLNPSDNYAIPDNFMAIMLYLGLVADQRNRGIELMLAIMELKLLRHVQRCGGFLEQISTLFEHRGKRAIFYSNWRKFTEGMSAELKRLFEMICLDLQKPFTAF